MSDANNKKQDYLAEAYRIAYYQSEDRYVSTTAIADELGVSAPAVTRMIQRLKDAGYVDHEPYRGILLTPKGEREALRTIRKHRIVERFLVDVMGFGWHEVHDYADELGGTVGEQVINRMEKMAGYPRRCPHGEPIPTIDLKMPKVIDEPLSEVSAGVALTVSRVHTHDGNLLHYLSALGLKPGVSFNLVEVAPFNGPLKLHVNDTEKFIGNEIARLLHVCPPHLYELN